MTKLTTITLTGHSCRSQLNIAYINTTNEVLNTQLIIYDIFPKYIHEKEQFAYADTIRPV